MPISYEADLKKDLTKKRLLSCYIIFGDDLYLKKHYIKKISSLVTTDDDIFNMQQFNADSSLQDVYDSVLQLPMMAEMKCVILSDFDYQHADKGDLQKLISIINDKSDTTLFIIAFNSVEFDYKKDAKAKKIISAVEKAGGKTVALNHRRDAELTRMLVDGAKKRGCLMNLQSARYLLEQVGTDITLLQHELEKLCSYANNTEITNQVIDLVAVKSVESSVYNLTKEIISCNVSSAIKILDDLLFSHVEPIIIQYTVASYYVDMYRIYSAKKSGLTINDVSQDFGYKGKEFVLERAAISLKKLSDSCISLSLDVLVETDNKLKSFNSDYRVILEQMIIKLVYIIEKGDNIDKT